MERTSSVMKALQGGVEQCLVEGFSELGSRTVNIGGVHKVINLSDIVRLGHQG